MSRSNDPRHFFQSDSEIQSASRKAAKAENNTAGSPIKLPSKILAVHLDPNDDAGLTIFVAESAGTARRLRLPPSRELTGGKTADVDTRHVYRGPTAPLTSLALSPSGSTLFSGSWDMSIWSWDVSTRTPQRRYTGHTDFVKSLLTFAAPLPFSSAISDKDYTSLLISGSADATIIIWDTASAAKLITLRDTGRILSLAIDNSTFAFPNPLLHTPDGNAIILHPAFRARVRRGINPPSAFTLYSASADPAVRCWHISTDAATGVLSAEEGPRHDVLAHDTSVNGLFFAPALRRFPLGGGDLPEELDDEPGRLWTASSDGSARGYVAAGEGEGRVWRLDASLGHPDYVRDVVFEGGRGLVITACRDEEVRVFEAEEGGLVHVWRGHFEEVMGLTLVGGGKEVVSVSIDGTMRRWSLDAREMKNAREREEEVGAVGSEMGKEKEKEEKKKENMLTEDEERELAELMDEDD